VTAPSQKAEEARAIRAAPLDAERVHVTEVGGPFDEGRVAIRGRGDEEFAQHTAKPVESVRDVLILVGVDADDDIGPR
jgi:hypothetical protein